MATTTGTATAACNAGEQEMLLQADFSETVTGPLVVLLAALLAVLAAELLKLCVAVSEAPAVGDTDVAKVDDVCAAAPLPDPLELVLEADADAVAEVSVLVNRPPPVFVFENSTLSKDEIALCMLAVSNSVVPTPVKPAF